jgi:hypothetical protein
MAWSARHRDPAAAADDGSSTTEAVMAVKLSETRRTAPGGVSVPVIA